MKLKNRESKIALHETMKYSRLLRSCNTSLISPHGFASFFSFPSPSPPSPPLTTPPLSSHPTSYLPACLCHPFPSPSVPVTSLPIPSQPVPFPSLPSPDLPFPSHPIRSPQLRFQPPPLISPPLPNSSATPFPGVGLPRGGHTQPHGREQGRRMQGTSDRVAIGFFRAF